MYCMCRLSVKYNINSSKPKEVATLELVHSVIRQMGIYYLHAHNNKSLFFHLNLMLLSILDA